MKAIKKQKFSAQFRLLASFVILAFSSSLIIFPQKAQAQTVLDLPAIGTMVTTSPAYVPAVIKGIKIFPDNPLRFDFIIDTGDSGLEGDDLKVESEKLIKYFLASLTVPEEDLWVNLSPYEKDRIIPNVFGETEMGRDLLAQDYILKQLTASLVYPEDELGKDFWNKVYSKATELFGAKGSNIPINTFNKVWIVPSKAVVYENADVGFVVESKLKVMLEQDYLSLENNSQNKKFGTDTLENGDVEKISNFSSNIVRDVVLPAIEKEVNEGTHFANLRQIYNSMILATWFKQKLLVGTGRDLSLLGQVYVDQNKIAGVDVEDKDVKQKIYDQYVEAFEKGVYNYIKRSYNPSTRMIVTKKYFSGGIVLASSAITKFGKPIITIIRDSKKFKKHVSALIVAGILGGSLVLAGCGLSQSEQSEYDSKSLMRGLVRKDHPVLQDILLEFDIPIVEEGVRLAEAEELSKEYKARYGIDKEFKNGEPEVFYNVFDFLEKWKDRYFYKNLSGIKIKGFEENDGALARAFRGDHHIEFYKDKVEENGVLLSKHAVEKFHKLKRSLLEKRNKPQKEIQERLKLMATRFRSMRSLVGTISHEIAHVFHYNLTLQEKTEIEELKQEAGEDINNYPTEYSMKNHFEFFAELFEAWMEDTEGFIELAIDRANAGNPFLLKRAIPLLVKYLQKDGEIPFVSVLSDGTIKMEAHPFKMDDEGRLIQLGPYGSHNLINSENVEANIEIILNSDIINADDRVSIADVIGGDIYYTNNFGVYSYGFNVPGEEIKEILDSVIDAKISADGTLAVLKIRGRNIFEFVNLETQEEYRVIMFENKIFDKTKSFIHSDNTVSLEGRDAGGMYILRYSSRGEFLSKIYLEEGYMTITFYASTDGQLYFGAQDFSQEDLYVLDNSNKLELITTEPVLHNLYTKVMYFDQRYLVTYEQRTKLDRSLATNIIVIDRQLDETITYPLRKFIYRHNFVKKEGDFLYFFDGNELNIINVVENTSAWLVVNRENMEGGPYTNYTIRDGVLYFYIDGEIRAFDFTSMGSSPVAMAVKERIPNVSENLIKSFANNVKKGGIDLNPANLNLETKGEGIDFKIPFQGLPCIDDDNDGTCERVDMEAFENMNIQGFTPVIFQIAPVMSLNLLLGINIEEDETQSPSDSAQGDESRDLSFINKYREEYYRDQEDLEEGNPF